MYNIMHTTHNAYLATNTHKLRLTLLLDLIAAIIFLKLSVSGSFYKSIPITTNSTKSTIP